MRLALVCFYCLCVFVYVLYFIATMSFAGYFLPVLFCMLSMLISDSRLIWFGSVYLVTTAGFVADQSMWENNNNNNITTQSGPVILVILCHSHWSSRGGINDTYYENLWSDATKGTRSLYLYNSYLSSEFLVLYMYVCMYVCMYLLNCT